MKRSTFKWMVLGGALAIIVMYGLEISTAGIGRVYGPVEPGSQAYEEAQPEQAAAGNSADDRTLQKIEQLEKELAELKKMAAGEEASGTDSEPEPERGPLGALPADEDRLPGIPAADDQSTVNRIADSTSGMLQNMSNEGIRIVVSIFDGLIK